MPGSAGAQQRITWAVSSTATRLLVGWAGGATDPPAGTWRPEGRGLFAKDVQVEPLP
jgi:hypothetical protein